MSVRKLLLIVCVLATFVAMGAAQTNSFLSDTSAQMSDSTVLSAQQFNQRPSLTGHYIKLLLITFVLLVIFYFALKVMRKLQFGNNPNTSERIRVLSKTYLTNKHSLWLVIINGNKYLLGITDQAINLIDNLGPASEDELQAALPATLPSFASFMEKLRKKD